MPEEKEGRPVDVTAIIVLIVVVLLLLAAWWLFPLAQQWISNTDCVASGRSNCSPAITAPR